MGGIGDQASRQGAGRRHRDPRAGGLRGVARHRDRPAVLPVWRDPHRSSAGGRPADQRPAHRHADHHPDSPLLADPELTGTALGPVGATRPVIEYFVAFPEEIDPGEPILLFWKTSGAISGAIYRLNLDGTPGRTWEVKLEGDLSVLPVLLGRTETYVLSITNGVTTVQQAAEVKVNCLTPWFFDPPPPEGCPQPEVFTSEAVAQEFEHGRMFWLQATGDILVLFDVSLDEFDDEATPTPQGTPVIEEDLPPAWLIFDDPWQI